MKACECGHTSYWSELPSGKAIYCFGCHQTFPSTGQGALESGRMVIDRLGSSDKAGGTSGSKEPFALPMESRPLRTTDWLKRWPMVAPELAKKFGWYIAEINAFEYLVMPITRGGQAIFYSARSLDARAPKKYHYPAGVKRDYWLSDDQLARQPIFFCEGVADAVALSPYGSSVGILGGFYDGRLNDRLKGRRVIVAFDGDFQGHCLGVQVASKIAGICQVSLCIYEGKDPTDWTREEAEASCR